MGTLDRTNRKAMSLTKKIWLPLFFVAVVLLTVGSPEAFAALFAGNDGWVESMLHYSPFFKMIVFLHWIFSNSLSSVDPNTVLITIVFLYYALWALVALSAILAVKKNQAWRHVLYVLFALDAVSNLIFPSVTLVIDIVLVVLFTLALRKAKTDPA